MAMEPFTEGRLEWSGDNPGIYLREQDDGPWVALALFFRVVVSPHGPGTIGLVVGDPDRLEGFPTARNLCISDNQALADYLIRDFVSVFPTFRGVAGLGALAHLRLKSARTESSEAKHSEFLASDGLNLELTWEGLGEAVAADIPAARSSTRKHRMYSVFRSARTGRIVINGTRLPGRAVPRDFHGRPMSSALLAFSESWILQPESAA
jgi:hypothetical protein